MRRQLLSVRTRKQNIVKISDSVDWRKASALFARNPEQEKQLGIVPSTREILHFIAAVGAVGLVLAFPPAITGVAALVRLGKRDYRSWGMRRQLDRLSRQKYITVSYDQDGNATVKITENGMTRALSYQLSSLKLEKPKRWDEYWRVVIFDVPEKKRKMRDRFREGLVQLGMYRFQESIYVSPYPCFNEVEFLRELIGVAVSVRYLLAVEIEEDQVLRSYFDLPEV